MTLTGFEHERSTRQTQTFGTRSVVKEGSESPKGTHMKTMKTYEDKDMKTYEDK